MLNRNQLQAYVEGAWRDVSMIDYHKGVLTVWQMLTDVYYINDVELRMKEEMTTCSKLKGVTEKPKLDLNKLTTSELSEYVELVEDKEQSEFLLERFIEKVTK